MIHTAFCEALGISHPIIQAGMGPFSPSQLAAAVSNAGGLGTVGASQRTAEQLRAEIAKTFELTSRPFAVNHLVSALNQEAFDATLEAKPPVISFALGDAGDTVKRCHDAGIRVIQQVHTVKQALEAAKHSPDVIIAQGSEAGGFGGTVAALALVPQVVDAVKPIPVVAAGGIADGRGLAAALILGAQGVNLGTRFLATLEAPISDAWKQLIVTANSEEAVKVEVWNDFMPAPGRGGYGTVPRAIGTSFINRWQDRREEARRDADRLQGELMQAMQAGLFHETVPFSGQTVGLIQEILPAGDVVGRIVAEAEELLRKVPSLLGKP